MSSVKVVLSVSLGQFLKGTLIILFHLDYDHNAYIILKPGQINIVLYNLFAQQLRMNHSAISESLTCTSRSHPSVLQRNHLQ